MTEAEIWFEAAALGGWFIDEETEALRRRHPESTYLECPLTAIANARMGRYYFEPCEIREVAEFLNIEKEVMHRIVAQADQNAHLKLAEGIEVDDY